MKLNRMLVFLALAFFSTGAGRVREGTELRASGGLSRYSWSDCGGRRFHVPDKPVALKASHVTKEGALFVAEAGLSSGRVDAVTKDGQDVSDASEHPALGDGFTTFGAALRLGWQFAYGGVEVGPLVFSSFHSRCDSEPGETCNTTRIVPSAEAWVGYPDWGYAWINLFSGPPVLSIDGQRIGTAALGIGRRSDTYRVELGGGLSGVLLQGDALVKERLSLGTSLHFRDPENWAALGTVGWHFGP